MKIISLLTLSLNVYAANWLTLQGTEAKAGHHPWGFFQIRAQNNEGEILIKNGVNKTPFSYVKPDLEKQKSIQLSRARVGLRGSLTQDNNVNYFLLSEFGKNGITQPLGHHQNNFLTDASLTFKYLPIYVRVGKFKYAGSEEGFMARFASPFINFTTLSDQLTLERFLDAKPSAAAANNVYVAEPLSGVGAYRDSGIQLFQTYPVGEGSSLSLSYMLGNGSGIENKNVNNDNYTHYGYAAFEESLGGGKGYKKEAYKLYGWYQKGKRLLYDNAVAKLYDRTRYGVGGTYFHKGLRLESEYVKGSGMIFTGAKDVNAQHDQETWNYETRASEENKAYGYYLASTYSLAKEFEVLARYDEYDRMTNSNAQYRKFQTSTLGFSYIFKKYDRIDVNYAINSVKAPGNEAANDLLKSVGNLLSLQYTMVFN